MKFITHDSKNRVLELRHIKDKYIYQVDDH